MTRLRVADEERVDCNPTLMTTRQITTALPWHQHQGISIISHNLQLLIIININHFSQSIPIIANAISIPIYSNALFKHKRQYPTQTHLPRVIVWPKSKWTGRSFNQTSAARICTNTNENKTKPNHVRPKRSGSVESLIRHLLPRWIAREDPPPHTSYPHSSKPLNFSPLFAIFLILHFSTKNFETFRLFQHFSCFLTFSYFYHFTFLKWMNCIEVKM